MARKFFPTRYLAFVDVLGFRNVIQRMTADRELFTTVRDALKSLQKQADQFRKYNRQVASKGRVFKEARSAPLPIPKGDLQMTAFSDSYVLSETFPAWHVLAAVQALGTRFLRAGILTRGAIVVGHAYHRNDVLFGPAVVEAYELEQEVAKYPRILVTDAVRGKVWGYHTGLCSGELLKQDVDGCWYVNLLVPPLTQWPAVSHNQASPDRRSYLADVRNALKRQLRLTEGKAGPLSKVSWLVHKFNEAADEMNVQRI
jgi:hypothetical protein